MLLPVYGVHSLLQHLTALPAARARGG
eukprot:SAG31_NODE_4776_length_2961_cov_5.154437_1_plen_26_part_10